jgi:rare lipoprotein A
MPWRAIYPRFEDGRQRAGNLTSNGSNGHSVVVTINDRGPFVRGRIIDVSPAAARVLGFSGLTHVTVNGE